MAVLTVLTGAFAVAADEQKPNIVVILADDYGWGSAGCYGVDGNLVRTPNIDRIAKEGRRFTDASVTASICSPSRYSILTGRYCWRTSLKFETLHDKSPLHIETNRPTLASMLRDRGYATAAVGKWHLGLGAPTPGATNGVDLTKEIHPGPLDVGFDYFYGIPSNHGDSSGIYLDTERNAQGENVTKVEGLRSTNVTPFGVTHYKGQFKGIDAPQRVDEEVMSRLTDRAISWIDQEQKSGKPFFLYFASVAVHGPDTPSEATRGTSKAGVYGDWIHELDRAVGRILDDLDKRGLTKNTLVVFSSDNGGENRNFAKEECEAIKLGLKMNGDWRAGKHSIFEGGMRIPFLASWPGHIPAGTVCDEPISLVDMFATFAALTGAPMPPREQAAEDSYNILPALLGEKTPAPLRPAIVGHSGWGVFSIRQGPWKWVEGKYATKKEPNSEKNEFHPQLYNLKDDPAEQHDVLSEHPDIAAKLSALLETYRNQGYSR